MINRHSKFYNTVTHTWRVTTSDVKTCFDFRSVGNKITEVQNCYVVALVDPEASLPNQIWLALKAGEPLFARVFWRPQNAEIAKFLDVKPYELVFSDMQLDDMWVYKSPELRVNGLRRLGDYVVLSVATYGCASVYGFGAEHRCTKQQPHPVEVVDIEIFKKKNIPLQEEYIPFAIEHHYG